MKVLSGLIIVVALLTIGATPHAQNEVDMLKAENASLKAQIVSQKELIETLEGWQSECMTRDFQRLQQNRHK